METTPMLFTAEITTREFYETPPEIAARMAVYVNVRPGELVLEPSVGSGALLRPLIGTSCVITAFDIAPERDPELFEVVRRFPPFSVFREYRDFLTINPKEYRPVDVVLMNPPLGRLQEMAHFTHAFTFLKPGGRMAAIVSAGITFRWDKRAVDCHELVTAHGGSIVPLPEDAFAASGLNLKTVLVTLTKKDLR